MTPVRAPGPGFTEADCYPIVAAIEKWIEIRKANGRPEFPSIADFRKSRLLLRLFQGKEPFPDPPPLANAGPWYELLDDGEGSAVGTHFYEAGDLPYVNIHGAMWRVRGRDEAANTYEVSHDGAPGHWRLERGTFEGVSVRGATEVGAVAFGDTKAAWVVVDRDNAALDRVTWEAWKLVRSD